MLRAERIFEPAGIEEELAAYNPLIPDGTNWKVTLLIEFTDPEERRIALGTCAVSRSAATWSPGRAASASGRSLTRTWSARPKKRPPRSIFFASSSSRGRAQAIVGGAAVTIGTDHPHYGTQAISPRRQSHASRRARQSTRNLRRSCTIARVRSADPVYSARWPVLHRLRYRGPERPRPRASPAGDVHRHPQSESSRPRSHRQQCR